MKGCHRNGCWGWYLLTLGSEFVCIQCLFLSHSLAPLSFVLTQTLRPMRFLEGHMFALLFPNWARAYSEHTQFTEPWLRLYMCVCVGVGSGGAASHHGYGDIFLPSRRPARCANGGIGVASAGAAVNGGRKWADCLIIISPQGPKPCQAVPDPKRKKKTNNNKTTSIRSRLGR